ncbi:unnamed protein product, partial [Closterium sp. NIES-53]
MSHVDPRPLVKSLEVSSDTSGPTEGGDHVADDIAATCRSPSLETPPGFPPPTSSPPLQPVAVDSGVAGGGDPGGADSRRAGFGGATSPTGGRVMGTPAGDYRSGRQPQLSWQETLWPRQLRERADRWGSPSGGAWGAGARGTGAGGPGAGGTGAGGAGARGAGAGGSGAGGASTGGAGAGGVLVQPYGLHSACCPCACMRVCME